MRALRITSFIIGISAFIITVIQFWHYIPILLDIKWSWTIWLMWPLNWYYVSRAVLIDPNNLIGLSLMYYCYYFITFSSPFLAYFLSKNLGRSRLLYCLLVFVFPFILAILALIDLGASGDLIKCPECFRVLGNREKLRNRLSGPISPLASVGVTMHCPHCGAEIMVFL